MPFDGQAGDECGVFEADGLEPFGKPVPSLAGDRGYEGVLGEEDGRCFDAGCAAYAEEC